MKSKGWIFWHAILMLAATVVALIYASSTILNLTVILSIGAMIVLNYGIWKKLHPAYGYANLVTGFRFGLLLCATSMYHVLSTPLFIALVVLVMIADGVDGYLARRYHQETLFGEVFDTEVDAFLALSLSFLIWWEHRDCGWVLVAGLLRYGFVIVYRLLGWHLRTRPSMYEAKVIAVIFFISLLVPFVLPWNMAIWIVAAGCALVTISFLREFYLISKTA